MFQCEAHVWKGIVSPEQENPVSREGEVFSKTFYSCVHGGASFRFPSLHWMVTAFAVY